MRTVPGTAGSVQCGPCMSMPAMSVVIAAELKYAMSRR
jgi:hypothetical protein